MNTIISIEDHVKLSEVHRNQDAGRTFDYKLSDKASKSKILKAARRNPLEMEENSTSTNLVFSAGAWYHVVLPASNYFNDVKEEKTCRIGDYSVKIGGIKLGKEVNRKHVD